MPSIVIVNGVPNNVPITKFSSFMKKFILRNKKSQFRITRNGETELSIEFMSNKDAEKANRLLQEFEFSSSNTVYILSSYISFTSHSDNDFKPNNLDYDEVRCRSPLGDKLLDTDLEIIDKQIEIARKKRILLEEERKILLEEKKIELLKSSTPTNLDGFLLLENICKSTSLETINSILPQMNNIPPKNEISKNVYLKVRRRLFASMAKLFYANVKLDERYKLRNFIQDHLNRQLLDLMKQNGKVSYNQALRIYREKYPESNDKEYILEKIKEGRETIFNGDSKGSESELNESTNINELSELKTDLSLEDLDDWTDDESMNMTKESSDLQTCCED